MFIEYPKSLYMGGDQEAAHVVVHDAEQEKAQRALGFQMMGEPQEKARKPRKAKNDDSTSNH